MIDRLRSGLADRLGRSGYRARQLSLEEPLDRGPEDVSGSLYRIRPHDTNDIEAAACFFRSIHDVETNYRGVNTSDPGTFELWFDTNRVGIFLHAADERAGLVRRRLATAFEDPTVERVTSPPAFPAVAPDAYVAGARVRPRRHDYYPIRTHDEEGFPTDPLGEVAGAMHTQADGFVVLQVCYRPAKRSWTDASLFRQDGIEDVAHGLRQGRSVGWLNPRIRSASDADERLATRLEHRRREAAYHTIVRVLAVSSDRQEAATRAKLVAGTFRQLYDGPGGQGLTDVPVARRSALLHRRQLRGFLERVADRRWTDHASVLSVDELAGVVHLPTDAVGIPALDWHRSPSGEEISPASSASGDEDRNRRQSDSRFGTDPSR